LKTMKKKNKLHTKNEEEETFFLSFKEACSWPDSLTRIFMIAVLSTKTFAPARGES
jgi:hypothetical protein